MPCERMPKMIVISRETAQKIEGLLSKGSELISTTKALDKCLPSCRSLRQLGTLLKPIFEKINQLAEILDSFKKSKEIKREKKARRKARQCSHRHASCKAAKKGCRKT